MLSQATARLVQDKRILAPLTTHQTHHSSKTLILICAFNEEETLSVLLDRLGSDYDILVIDDGSVDRTRIVASNHGTNILVHEERLGKAASLADGISYALQNGYDMILEIDADSIPRRGAIQRVLNRLSQKDVGAVSCRQIPIGGTNLAYHIDELIWAALTEGKRLQIKKYGSCHVGSVLVGFKPQLVDSVEGSVNDDEQVGISIENKGYRAEFEDSIAVYFDASSSLGHILERRRRMYFGHMKFAKSTAPSMEASISALALCNAIKEDKRRFVWLFPALAMDFLARLLAWKDVRRPDKSKKYSRWVTTYVKDDYLAIHNRTA